MSPRLGGMCRETIADDIIIIERRSFYTERVRVCVTRVDRGTAKRTAKRSIPDAVHLICLHSPNNVLHYYLGPAFDLAMMSRYYSVQKQKQSRVRRARLHNPITLPSPPFSLSLPVFLGSQDMKTVVAAADPFPFLQLWALKLESQQRILSRVQPFAGKKNVCTTGTTKVSACLDSLWDRR